MGTQGAGPGFRLDTILGSVIIGAGIIIAGNLVAGRLPTTLTANVETSAAQPVEESEWLSQYEAAAYLRMDDSSLRGFLESGLMEGTYSATDGGPVFSREKLRTWMAQRIENQGR